MTYNVITGGHVPENIVIISQATSGCRDSKVPLLRQNHILSSDTHLEILVVVGHPIVEEDCQSVLEIFNLCFHRERLVPEISQAPGKLLSGPIVLVIKVPGPIIGHGHDIRVVVLVIIVERVKEDPQPNPLIIGPVHWPLYPLSC